MDHHHRGAGTAARRGCATTSGRRARRGRHAQRRRRRPERRPTSGVGVRWGTLEKERPDADQDCNARGRRPDRGSGLGERPGRGVDGQRSSDGRNECAKRDPRRVSDGAHASPRAARPGHHQRRRHRWQRGRSRRAGRQLVRQRHRRRRRERRQWRRRRHGDRGRSGRIHRRHDRCHRRHERRRLCGWRQQRWRRVRWRRRRRSGRRRWWRWWWRWRWWGWWRQLTHVPAKLLGSYAGTPVRAGTYFSRRNDRRGELRDRQRREGVTVTPVWCPARRAAARVRPRPRCRRAPASAA